MDAGTSRFCEVFKALPSTGLDYRPHPNFRSAGELVALLVSVEKSCGELCETGRTSYNSDVRWHTASGSASLEQMISAYEDHHRTLVGKLVNLDDAVWNRAAWLTRGEQEIILKDTVGGLLWVALFDAAHQSISKTRGWSC